MRIRRLLKTSRRWVALLRRKQLSHQRSKLTTNCTTIKGLNAFVAPSVSGSNECGLESRSEGHPPCEAWCRRDLDADVLYSVASTVARNATVSNPFPSKIYLAAGRENGMLTKITQKATGCAAIPVWRRIGGRHRPDVLPLRQHLNQLHLLRNGADTKFATGRSVRRINSRQQVVMRSNTDDGVSDVKIPVARTKFSAPRLATADTVVKKRCACGEWILLASYSIR